LGGQVGISAPQMSRCLRIMTVLLNKLKKFSFHKISLMGWLKIVHYDTTVTSVSTSTLLVHVIKTWQ